MAVIVNGTPEEDVQACLDAEAGAQGLDFLAVLYVPARGVEGRYLETGHGGDGMRHVLIRTLPKGRMEAHWQGAVDFDGHGLLDRMEALVKPWIAELLHGTVCQSLTAAHLHLELGLLAHPELSEFVTARELVFEANSSVRGLMDKLAGESS